MVVVKAELGDPREIWIGKIVKVKGGRMKKMLVHWYSPGGKNQSLPFTAFLEGSFKPDYLGGIKDRPSLDWMDTAFSMLYFMGLKQNGMVPPKVQQKLRTKINEWPKQMEEEATAETKEKQKQEGDCDNKDAESAQEEELEGQEADAEEEAGEEESPNAGAKNPVAEKPVAEKPVADKLVAEKPVVENPVAEAEDPMAEAGTEDPMAEGREEEKGQQ
ncbi:unnamed protein product [Chrysoparadoxa australica]